MTKKYWQRCFVKGGKEATLISHNKHLQPPAHEHNFFDAACLNILFIYKQALLLVFKMYQYIATLMCILIQTIKSKGLKVTYS